MSTTPHLPSRDGEPTWEVAYLLPTQGQWTEEDFFQFHTNRMVELADGHLELLPMPTWLHQLIVELLFDRFRDHVRQQNLGGKVLMAPLPAKLFPGTVREPDLLYVCAGNLPANVRDYPQKIDLAIEIASEGAEAHKRDYVDKLADYAKAGVAEYWIVDPEQTLVTIFVLDGTTYRVAQECHPGDQACSLLLDGLTISVNDIWALAQ